MKTILIFLFVLCSLFSEAQENNKKAILPPSNEFSLFFRKGRISPNVYFPLSGENIFKKEYLHYMSFGYGYSRYLTEKLKLGLSFELSLYEFKVFMKLNEDNVPGLKKYIGQSSYESWDYGFLSESYDMSYFCFPLHFDYQLLKPESRHQLWLSAGVDFRFFSGINMKYNSGLMNDTGNVNLMELSAHLVQENKVNMALTFALRYQFKLAYFHKISIGLKTGINFQDVITGEYTILPDVKDVDINGTFGNKVNYLGLELAYFINNAKDLNKVAKLELNKKYNKTNPDSVFNRYEWNFSMPLLGGAYLNTKGINNSITMPVLSGLFNEVRKYKSTRLSYALAADLMFERFVSRNGMLTSYNYVNIPGRVNYDLPLGKRSRLSFGGGPSLQVRFGYYEGAKYMGYSNYRITYIKEINHVNWVGAGIGAQIRFFRYFRNMNKLYVSLRYDYPLTNPYTVEYYLFDQNANVEKRSFKMKPHTLYLTIGYGITWKRLALYKQGYKN